MHFQGEKLLNNLGGMFSMPWKPKKTKEITGPVTSKGFFFFYILFLSVKNILHFSISEDVYIFMVALIILAASQMIITEERKVVKSKGRSWD